MTENALRDHSTTSAAAWLMRGRADAVPAPLENLVPLPPGPNIPQVDEAVAPDRRDWSSTLDLIYEATAAIRISQERSSESEKELRVTVAQAIEREQVLEGKLAESETRAELAEKRASEAEEWLARLHEAVVNGFTQAGA